MRTRRIAAFLGSLSLFACSGEGLRDVAGEEGEACGTPGCVSGLTCAGGTCRRRCVKISECAEGSACLVGACQPAAPRCGDERVDPGETCDDGGRVDGDGCSADCVIEVPTTRWKTSDWTACSAVCGEGVHSRRVTCVGAGDAELPDGRCAGDKPVTIQACEDTSGCSCAPATCTGTCILTDPGEHAVAIPSGCSTIRARLWGGGGGGGSQVGSTGGGSAFVSGRIAVTAGEGLKASVARGGKVTGNVKGDGGGASLLERGTTLLAVAAGGGGGGSDGCSGCSSGGRGGAGGADVGERGENLLTLIAPYCTSATGGAGGTQSAGGEGGTQSGTAQWRCVGETGASLAGGSANGGTGEFSPCLRSRATRWESGGGQGNGGGGGGGAGYFGGGGAGFIWTYCSGGGGGGSSWVVPGATEVQREGGVARAQANVGASNGAGRGGDRDADGENGRIEIDFVP